MTELDAKIQRFDEARRKHPNPALVPVPLDLLDDLRAYYDRVQLDRDRLKLRLVGDMGGKTAAFAQIAIYYGMPIEHAMLLAIESRDCCDD